MTVGRKPEPDQNIRYTDKGVLHVDCFVNGYNCRYWADHDT